MFYKIYTSIYIAGLIISTSSLVIINGCLCYIILTSLWLLLFSSSDLNIKSVFKRNFSEFKEKKLSRHQLTKAVSRFQRSHASAAKLARNVNTILGPLIFLVTYVEALITCLIVLIYKGNRNGIILPLVLNELVINALILTIGLQLGTSVNLKVEAAIQYFSQGSYTLNEMKMFDFHGYFSSMQ